MDYKFYYNKRNSQDPDIAKWVIEEKDSGKVFLVNNVEFLGFKRFDTRANEKGGCLVFKDCELLINGDSATLVNNNNENNNAKQRYRHYSSFGPVWLYE